MNVLTTAHPLFLVLLTICIFSVGWGTCPLLPQRPGLCQRQRAPCFLHCAFGEDAMFSGTSCPLGQLPMGCSSPSLTRNQQLLHLLTSLYSPTFLSSHSLLQSFLLLTSSLFLPLSNFGSNQQHDLPIIEEHLPQGSSSYLLYTGLNQVNCCESSHISSG